jgi:HSP20 family protein
MNLTERIMAKKEDKEDVGRKVGGALGGIFSGLTELVEKLSELAEKGEELSKSGKLEFDSKVGKELKGVYGFSIKTGIGGQGVKVEPFGNIKEDKKTGRSVVQEVREPIIDIFEEDDYALVVAEMPGVDVEDIDLTVNDDVLTITAESEDKKYQKEVLLPDVFPREKMSITCKNGIVRIKCEK